MEVALGNVIGSNIFNSFAILGATAVTKPIEIDQSFLSLDIWVMLAASVMLLPLMLTGARISKFEGMAFLAAYCAYIGWIFYRI